MFTEQHLNRLALTGYRPSTVTSRRDVLRNFTGFIKPKVLTEVTQHDIEAFLARPLAAQTRRAYRGHLNSFYNWLVDEGRIETNPCTRVPAIKTHRGLPRPIPAAELSRAIHDATPRLRAWLVLMCFAGLRACEVAALRPEDVIRGPVPFLYLREVKGGGQDTIPAHPYILECLDALHPEKGLYWDVSPKWVSASVNRFLRSLGSHSTGHAIRHYFGTDVYRVSGHDLRVAQELLRHKDVSNTQIYTKFDPVRPAEVIRLLALPSAS